MKRLMRIIKKAGSFATLNALALIVVAQSVNAACSWMLYQPEVPEAAKRFKKD